jgi:pimeloyl-ACP methyl ester carboxylesterase
VIHGELDELAPVQQAVEMHHAFKSVDKRLLTVPGAGHNDLLYYGINEYFAAIREFTGA